MLPERYAQKKQTYTFCGAVKVYDRLVDESFRAKTCATSKGKARSNIAYQYRKKANIANHIPVTLIGDVVSV